MSDYGTEKELWVCSHTKKCGWQGRYSELGSRPHPKWERATQSICPRCGGHTFFIRPIEDHCGLQCPTHS